MSVIFFDLDGTLTDPKPGITRSIQFALEKLDREVPPQDQLVWCIGPPLLGSFENMLGDRQLAETALSLYRERFADIGLYENSVYPGIEESLRILRSAGHDLFVATSKPTIYAERIIEHFSLSTHFERIYASELDGARSDKTELLRHALEELEGSKQNRIMIGDRGQDMIGGRNNGMTAVGVLYGYGSEEELIAAGAHHIARSTADLTSIIP